MLMPNFVRLNKVKLLVFIVILSFIFLYALQMKTVNFHKNDIASDNIHILNIAKSKATKINNDKSKHATTSVQVQTTNIAKSNPYNITQPAKNQMKYILQWTSPRSVPFTYMGVGQQGFIERKCPYTNCFVTGNRNYLSDITKFDVVAFTGSEVVRMGKNQLPARRSPHQKYAFASIESSDYYPVCSNNFDGYFNWTWTFRLDSEVRWGYMVIRDELKNMVGPNKVMHWIKFEDMRPVSDEFKEQLKSKTKAAAWFVSNCWSRSKREDFVKRLQNELKKYDLSVDVYGDCGTFKCSRSNEAECFDLLKEKYYFYLSFENSYSEDYVTEKLLNAVMHDALPIVYGAANYTRFLPDGAYLNARELGVETLAAKMNRLIQHPDEYAEYFRWKNHYSYHRQSESVYTDEYCNFCSILNDKEKVEKTTVYHNFRNWWDPPNKC